MKKILTLITMLLLTMSFAMATYDECSLTHYDPNCGPQIDFCVEKGYDFTIATYYYSWHTQSFKLKGEVVSPFEISMSGNYRGAIWEANPAVAAVYENFIYEHNGGFEGEFRKSSKVPIGFVTFCGDEEDYDVPEFGVLAAIAVLGLAGLFIYKRRN